MEYACRACRIKLAADVEGCAVCRTIRQNLVPLDEDQSEHPSLTSVSQEMVKSLRARFRYYEHELKGAPGNETLAKAQIRTVNAATKLLEAGRRLQSDGLAAVEAMSFVERARLFVQWYAALPASHRGRLREQMASFEESLAVPAPVTVQYLPPAE